MSSLVTLKKLFNDEKIILVLIVRKVRRAHEWPNRQLIRAREAKFFIMDILVLVAMKLAPQTRVEETEALQKQSRYKLEKTKYM